jgi:sugar lactone lactonase YvrE
MSQSTTREITPILEGYGFFENPHWRGDQLWLADKAKGVVYGVSEDGEVEEGGRFDETITGIGWTPEGALLVATLDLTVWRRDADGSLVRHADLTAADPHHMTDMLVDKQGRMYLAHAGFSLRKPEPFTPSTIIRVDLDGSHVVAATDVFLPNTMSLRDGGSTFLVGETMGQRLTAFAVRADGSLTNRHDFATFGPPLSTEELFSALRGDPDSTSTMVPDGHTNDAEGAVWVADVAARDRVIRVREGGEILDEIVVDGAKIYACELGGDDGRTLFMCAAVREWGSGANVGSDDESASLLTCRVDVPATV